MIDVVRAVILSLLGIGAFGLVLVLPGVRLADRFLGPRGTAAGRLILAFVWSQILIGGAGIALVAVGRFSGLAVAIVAVALSIGALPVVARWARSVRRPPVTIGWLGLLATPWIGFVGLAGWPPADTLQWYYAGLGSQLTAAGGMPTSTAEWGLAVRWLPDYLVFNIDSEAYLAILSFLPKADALAAFRVPVVILGLALLVVLLRLWLGRPAAVIGATAIAGSTFFLAKFDAFKPEALGIVVGLAAAWLVVTGLRRGRASWVLLGGALLGLDLSIHAIAAAVMGLLVAGFAAAEWLFVRKDRWPRFGWLVRAAALGLLISVAMGVAVQGRANVAPAALNPVTVGGADPTWTFFLRSTGDFTEPQPAQPARPLAGGVTSPWAGFRVTSAFGWWLFPVLAIGMAFLFGLGGRRPRTAVIGLLAAGALIGAGVLFFAIRFDTYVPRWTGLVRFGQYAPLLAGLAVAIAAAGYLRAWSWLAEIRIPRRLPWVLAVLGVAWLIPIAATRYAVEARVEPAGIAAMAELRAVGEPGDVVLSNALTTGTIESFTGLEAPLEGRQPLIEDPTFLATANQLLLDAHSFFVNPGDRTLLDRLGVRWVLAVDHQDVLGAPATLGGTTALLRGAASLHEAWSGDGVALFEVVDPKTTNAIHDSRVPVVDLSRTVIVGLVGGLIALILVGPGSSLSILRRVRGARGVSGRGPRSPRRPRPTGD